MNHLKPLKASNFFMLTSLGFILIVFIFVVRVLWPFNKHFSYEFVCWFTDDFISWSIPIALAVFVISSQISTQSFGQILHDNREKKEKEGRE